MEAHGSTWKQNGRSGMKRKRERIGLGFECFVGFNSGVIGWAESF